VLLLLHHLGGRVEGVDIVRGHADRGCLGRLLRHLLRSSLRRLVFAAEQVLLQGFEGRLGLGQLLLGVCYLVVELLLLLLALRQLLLLLRLLDGRRLLGLVGESFTGRRLRIQFLMQLFQLVFEVSFLLGECFEVGARLLCDD
jgi:hypothetical protein